MKKSKRKLNLLSKVFLIILNIIGIIDIFLIIKLNVLPWKFLIPIILVLVIILVALSVLLTRKKKKKKKIYLVTFIITILFSLGGYYLLATLGFLNSFGNNIYNEEIYSVVILKESSYKELKDLDGETMGIIKNDVDGQNKALKNINKKISFTKKDYPDSGSLAFALLDKSVTSILLEKAQLEMINENIDGFENLTRVLYDYSVKIKVDKEIEKIDVTNDFFNIYVSGIDTYGSVNKTSRSDVNLVVSVNPKTHEVLLTSIPRDYYVSLAGKTGYKDKLTHAGIYGVETSMNTIADLLDTKIDYYVKVNFSSLINIVDTLGGINVYSNYNFTTIDGINFKKGNNVLDGKKALSFVRERKAFGDIGGDRVRGENQQIVLKALIEKAISPGVLTKYNALLKSVDNSFITNIPKNYVTTLINKQLDENVKWNITTQNLDGTNGYDYTYSYQHQKLYVMIPDENSLYTAREKINLLSK